MDSRTLKMAKVFDSGPVGSTVVTWVEQKGGRKCGGKAREKGTVAFN
jgi:hypothetical protein